MPNELRPEPGSPADWLRIARGDLALAQIERPKGVPTELLCLHAQQAAEKAAKAVLVENGITVPLIHDIAKLVEDVSDVADVWEEVQQAARLSEYAVVSRYPADLGAVDDDEHRRAVALAEAVVRWPRRT